MLPAGIAYTYQHRARLPTATETSDTRLASARSPIHAQQQHTCSSVQGPSTLPNNAGKHVKASALAAAAPPAVNGEDRPSNSSSNGNSTVARSPNSYHQDTSLLRLTDITLQLSHVLWGQPAPPQSRQQRQQPAYTQLVSCHIVVQPTTCNVAETNGHSNETNSPLGSPGRASLTSTAFKAKHQHMFDQLPPFQISAVGALVTTQLLSQQASAAGAAAVVLTGPYLPSQLKQMQAVCARQCPGVHWQLLLGPRGLHVVISLKPWKQQQQQQQQEAEPPQQWYEHHHQPLPPQQQQEEMASLSMPPQQQQEEMASLSMPPQQQQEEMASLSMPPQQQQEQHGWQDAVLSAFDHPTPVTDLQLADAASVEQLLYNNLCLFSSASWAASLQQVSSKRNAGMHLAVMAVLTTAELQQIERIAAVGQQLQIVGSHVAAAAAAAVDAPPIAAAAETGSAAAVCELANDVHEVVIVASKQRLGPAALRAAQQEALRINPDAATAAVAARDSRRRHRPTNSSSSSSRQDTGLVGARMHVCLGEAMHDVWEHAVSTLTRHRQQYIETRNLSSSSSSSSCMRGSRTRRQQMYPVMLVVSGPGLDLTKAVRLLQQQQQQQQSAEVHQTEDQDATAADATAGGGAADADAERLRQLLSSSRWPTAHGHSFWRALQRPAMAAGPSAGSSSSGGLSTIWAWLYRKGHVAPGRSAAAAAVAETAAVQVPRRRRRIPQTRPARSSSSSSNGTSDTASGHDISSSRDVTLILSWQQLDLPQQHPRLGSLLQQCQLKALPCRGPEARPAAAADDAGATAGRQPDSNLDLGLASSSTEAAGRQMIVLPAAPHPACTTTCDDTVIEPEPQISSGTGSATGRLKGFPPLESLANDDVLSRPDTTPDNSSSGSREQECDECFDVSAEHVELISLFKAASKVHTKFVMPATYDQMTRSGKLGHRPLFQGIRHTS